MSLFETKKVFPTHFHIIKGKCYYLGSKGSGVTNRWKKTLTIWTNTIGKVVLVSDCSRTTKSSNLNEWFMLIGPWLLVESGHS